ncbi:Methyltransferase type 11 [Akanthomyces lecanii RCEF 1005]|uniref:Methyltransferase type 11 n=1 Tax=Akanthomyces lecanii RCEF 1005 TaxID=1081108 RepID=A0A168I1A8_CORDF|nr:Methyltransferase type 11 [Akanthomyces lecanii RCEF 1005]
MKISAKTQYPSTQKKKKKKKTHSSLAACVAHRSIASSSASLTDSIFEYRALHGRTYQVSKSTEYWGPNDETQNEGLDLAHALITMLMGDRLFAAPLAARGPANVLDVGTGTGIWALDMADAYPSASVVGTDISPIQPSWVPPNCTFYLDDAQLDWTFEPASFDFIHIRALYGSINDWRRLYAQARDALMPGGWIENFEFTILLRSDAPHVRDDPQHIFKRWAAVFCEAADRLDRTLRIGNSYTMHRLLREAGFEDVTQKYYQVPVGGWSSDPVYRKIGIYNLAFMEQSLEGFALFLLREIMKWTYERVQIFLMEMRAEIRNAKIRPYYLMTNAYARKPE